LFIVVLLFWCALVALMRTVQACGAANVVGIGTLPGAALAPLRENLRVVPDRNGLA
jgi:hypothetical protein